MLHSDHLIFGGDCVVKINVCVARKSPQSPFTKGGGCQRRRASPLWKRGGQGRFQIRVSVLVTLLIFLPHALSFPAQSPTPLSNITIAYTSISPQYSPVWIAKEAGFFKNNGINAQLVYMRGGIIATQALVSNDVNFISAGGGGVVDAVLGGAEICIVASPINQEPQVLVAKKEIKEIGQLKGKKLAVNSLAGPSLLSLKMILAAAGLDPDRDVSYLATGPSASRFGALQLGQVDATTLTPPFTSAARKRATPFLKILQE